MTPFPEFLRKFAPEHVTDATIVVQAARLQTDAKEIFNLKQRIDFVKPTSELGKLLQARVNYLRDGMKFILHVYDMQLHEDSTEIGHALSGATWKLL